MKKRGKIYVLVLIIMIFLFVIIPYAKVEILTYKYGKEFSDLYRKSRMLDTIAYFNVMEYSETTAKVYYVQSEHLGADMFTFTKRYGKWELETWKTVWSKYGNADEFIWPYYR